MAIVKQGVLPQWLIELILGTLIIFCAWGFKEYVSTEKWKTRHEVYIATMREIQVKYDVRIGYLESQANKGERFTSKDAQELEKRILEAIKNGKNN